MGSIPSEDTLRELEREAYVAILRAVYVRPHQDSLALEVFLEGVRKQLSVTLEMHAEFINGVRTEIELIRQGKPLPDSVRKGFAYSAIPPGTAQPAVLLGINKDHCHTAVEDTTIAQHVQRSKQALGKRKASAAQQKQAAEAKKAKTAARPIGAPGGSRNRSRPHPSGGTSKAQRQSGGGGGGTLQRSRSTRASADPTGYLGRIIWRFYPNEDEARPWVEGFLIDYDHDTKQYKILFDPHTDRETIEPGFDFSLASPDEYIMGDFFGDLSQHHGSRRLAQAPEAVYIPPPSVPALTTAPSKRRRSSVKVPHLAPFPVSWFESVLTEASLDDLNSMLSMLERKEIDLCMDIEMLDREMAMGEDLDKRAELERKFEDLCKKEADIMAELARLVREQ